MWANVKAFLRQRSVVLYCLVVFGYMGFMAVDSGKSVVKLGAHAGCRNAQFELGWRYAYGIGYQKDLGAAIRWLSTAAERGDTRAQMDLGYLYGDGVLMEKDVEEAIRWYSMAAEAGDTNARKMLERIDSRGETGGR